MTHHRVLASTVVALAASVTGAAVQPTFILTRQDVPSYAGARAVVAGDFDRDGWIDLAHANAGRNTVTVLLNVLLNQGSGERGFVRAHDVPVGQGPFDLAAGDFNRDGRLDLAVTHGSASAISILRGTATGGFVRTDLAVPAGPRGIAAVDINKDGRLDLIVTGWDAGSIRVLLGDGSGGFISGASPASLASRPQGVAAADFNHDGYLDLVVAHESGTGLVLYTSRAGTSYQARAISGMANLNVLTVGDFNRDGWADVAAASASSSRAGVYLGGEAGLRFDRSYPTGHEPRGITSRDVNVDGLLDLLIANRGGDDVSALFGSPADPGTFDAADSWSAGAGSRSVVTDDFDRDGRIDVVTGNQDAAVATALWNDTAFDRAAYSFGRLSYGTPSLDVGGSRAIPADFNEDGKLDVVVKPYSTSGPVLHVLLTDGPVVMLRYQQFAGDYLVADFNRDDHMDVLLVEQGTLVPHLGDGRGGFTPGPMTVGQSLIGRVVAGDLNQDAATDLLTVGFDPAQFAYFIQVLLGVGDGRFTEGGRVITTGFGSVIGVADQTRDGRPDVIALVDGILAVYRGDGAGGLALSFSSGFNTALLQTGAVGDLNHDGVLDVVSSAQSSVVVLLGTGSGFAAQAQIPISGFRNSAPVVIADINLDGRPDIVGSGFILRGRGDGTFEPEDRFVWDGLDVHVVDFTRDGLPDVVVPTTNGAFDVLVNERNSVNHAPTVDAGPDHTFGYTDQFGERPPEIAAMGGDVDQHDLDYEWRDQSGAIVETERWLRIRDLPHGTYTFVVTVRDRRGGTASDSVRVTIEPTAEIVLWAATGMAAGSFSIVDDASAADGRRVYDSNLNRARINVPQPFADNHLFINFAADPTQTYKLWLRLKADGNHWSNDSVWVQFTGAVNSQGAPAYRVGTTSALAVNLEECLNCGVSGWGWADDGWGAPNLNGVTLRFPAGGHQTLVIQTREDGVSIDQVVLSAVRYLTARPGPARNDTTILPVTWVPEL